MGCSHPCGRPGGGKTGAWQRHDGVLGACLWRFAALYVLCLYGVKVMVTVVPPPSSSAGCFQPVHSPVPAKPLACDIQPPTHSSQPAHILLPGRLTGSRPPFHGLLVTSPSPTHHLSHLHCFQCDLWPAHHSTHLSSHAYRTCVLGTPPPPSFLAWGYVGRRFACAHPRAGVWRQIMMGTFKFKFITKQWCEIVASCGLLALRGGVRVVV